MDVRLFVIVVTYKGMRWYKECFTSLRQSTIPLSIVVVDNFSNDGTVDYLRDSFPEIHLIESNTNLGFGKANNVGIRYALDKGCDYIFLLNQDAWVEPDTFEKLIAIHQRNTDYGILGCINVTKEKDHMLEGFIPTVSDPRNCDPCLIDDMYFGRLKDLYEVKSILAAAWLMPRKTLDTIGGFDPVFFHYGEDDNYLQRARFHGFKIGVCPLCPIVHDTKSARVDNAVLFRKKEYAEKRDWLLDWCNIEKKCSTRSIKRSAFFDVMKSLFLFRFEKMNRALYRYRFLKQNLESIRKSRLTNIQVGRLYLED